MSHLFWLTTLVPGFALLQLFWPRDLRRGLLGVLTWSFILTMALFAPFVVLAYVVHFSVATVAAFYFGMVLIGLAVLVLRGRWPSVRRMVRSTPWPETAVILLAIAVSSPFGGSAAEDSYHHTAKIRYLRDVEFGLQDPYSPDEVIETRHHINVLHATFTVATWVSGEEPLRFWFESAWFFRILAMGGVGYLAAALYRSRWIGTVAMLSAVGMIGVAFNIVYPLAVSGYAVLPPLMAATIDAIEKPTRGDYAKIFLGSLCLVVVHVGYWLIALMCLAPVLGGWALWRRRGEALRQAGTILLLMTAAGLPFLLVTALSPNNVAAQEAGAHDWMLRSLAIGGRTITILDPTHYAWMLPTVAATALMWMVYRQGRLRLGLAAAVFGVSMVYMFTPIAFDYLTEVVPHWLIRRARFIGESLAYASIAGGVAWIARPTLRRRPLRVALALVIFCGGIVTFRVNIRNYFTGRSSEFALLERADQLQETVRGTVPTGALVAADPALSLMLPSVHLARVMAPERFNSNPSDSRLVERYEAGQELLDAGTTAARRREIVSTYGIDFVLLDDTHAASVPGIEQVASLTVSRYGFRLYRVGG